MKINKRIKVLDFKLSKILNGGLFGGYKSMFSGNGMEFSEHREYTFGDHVKDIDWKASNKTNQMYVKNYEEERDLNVLFVLDNSESMQFGSQDITKKELEEDFFYFLSISAYHNNDNIGGIIFDGNNFNFINYKKSRDNIYKILDLLDKKSNCKKTPDVLGKPNKILENIIKRGVKDNLIFILTDNIFNIDEKLLRLVGNKNELVFINIFDYFENNLTNLGGNISLNLGSNFLNIDLSNKKKINDYADNRNREIKYIKAIFDRNKIGYISVDTKSDIFKELMGYFNKIKK